VALYLDTSCLLKVFFAEPETKRTLDLVSREERVVVSTLARLEADVQVQGRLAGGLLKKLAVARLLRQIDAVLETDPYETAATPPSVYELASRQIRPLGETVHCRALDRLHLATMEALGLRRLLTNDAVQASAARALGYDVLVPH